MTSMTLNGNKKSTSHSSHKSLRLSRGHYSLTRSVSLVSSKISFHQEISSSQSKTKSRSTSRSSQSCKTWSRHSEKSTTVFSKDFCTMPSSKISSLPYFTTTGPEARSSSWWSRWLHTFWSIIRQRLSTSIRLCRHLPCQHLWITTLQMEVDLWAHSITRIIFCLQWWPISIQHASLMVDSSQAVTITTSETGHQAHIACLLSALQLWMVPLIKLCTVSLQWTYFTWWAKKTTWSCQQITIERQSISCRYQQQLRIRFGKLTCKAGMLWKAVSWISDALTITTRSMSSDQITSWSTSITSMRSPNRPIWRHPTSICSYLTRLTWSITNGSFWSRTTHYWYVRLWKRSMPVAILMVAIRTLKLNYRLWIW